MAARKTQSKKELLCTDESVGSEVETIAESAPAKKKIQAKEVDLTQYVTVRNGFHGRLVYNSQRTGEHFVWKNFGDEQEMELRELRNARNSDKKYFENNWFMFDEDWVVEFLGVKQFYKYAISIDSFDDIFSLPADKLRETISRLSSGQMKSVAYRAKELIASEVIDSISVVKTLEDVLGVELTQK